MRTDICMDLFQPSSGLFTYDLLSLHGKLLFLHVFEHFIFKFSRHCNFFLSLAICFTFVSVMSDIFIFQFGLGKAFRLNGPQCLKSITEHVFLSFQPSRQQPSVVPHSPQSHKALGLQPVQVAGHQDCHSSPAAGHAGSFPLQHAWLHGQENAGSLRYCSDTSAEGSSNFTNQMACNCLFTTYFLSSYLSTFSLSYQMTKRLFRILSANRSFVSILHFQKRIIVQYGYSWIKHEEKKEKLLQLVLKWK